ncbi:MAG: hypothetical protein JNM17_13040 [Archangium sp.]|nr:hypothetical protein [Archangium sp.]
MAAPPILLVADDLAVIASVKRVLGREGYECVLATSAADAVIGFGHSLPGLVLLQPSVESDRGAVVLEELQNHPDNKLLKVVLLGETVPGFPWPVEPLPIDPVHFATTIDENVRTGTSTSGTWSVIETATSEIPKVAPPDEPDAWRATSPSETNPGDDDGEQMPEPTAITEPPPSPPAADFAPEPTAPTPPVNEVSDAPAPTPPDPLSVAANEAMQEQLESIEEPAPTPPPDTQLPAVSEALEEKLFGDLAADVEASAMQSVESTLQQRALADDAETAPAQSEDEELQRLEDEVRAEAQRRRQSRQAQAVEVKPAPPTPPPAEPLPPIGPADASADLTESPTAENAATESSFAELSESDAPAMPSHAGDVLARAEQMLIETRAQSEARRRADEAEARRAANETEALTQRAQQAEEARGVGEEELTQTREELKRVSSLLENEKELARVRHENALSDAAADAEAARATLLSNHSQALEVLQSQLRAETSRRSDAEQHVEGLRKKLKTIEEEFEEASAQAAAARREAGKRDALEKALAEERAAVAELGAKVSQLELIASTATEETQKRQALEAAAAEREAALATARADAEAAMALANEVEAERQKLEETRSQLEVTQKHLDEARSARDTAQSEMLQLEQTKDQLQSQLRETQSSLESARADMTSSSELLEETARERDGLRAKANALEPFKPLAERLGSELEAERVQRVSSETRLNEASVALEAARTQAERLEATAQMASEKVRELEAREVMSLALPGHRPVGIARHGSVKLDGLARVVCQLVLGNAEARLELGTAGGTRTLWFKRGQIIAAESTFDAESLIGRARRDGLIDARQDNELRMMKGATPREQLDALKARAFIRDIESVPLVQRYTEQVALDGFTEEETQYRIVEEAPKPEVLLATVPRPTLPMLAESLRRAVAPDVMLERLGGGEAVPVATDSELDLRALGFSERERKMLTWIDGEATVEDLSLASGLKPDAAFRALLVARLLGFIDVKPGQKKTENVSGNLDVQRLEAKFDEVQDADYFTILGLSRAAGSEDVRRAYQRLSQEFDPLRFSGHPDATLQQRAQVVANLLEEAAKALEDDRRRVEYARHLLD